MVETPADLLMMEQAQCYQGLYFVLMGALSPLDGVGPRDIHLDCLVQRAMDDVVRETILATIPMGRLGEGAEVAAAVVYLASNEAAYVTGHTLHVNGGMAMF